MSDDITVERLSIQNVVGVNAYVQFRRMLWDELTDEESRTEAEEILRGNRMAVLVARGGGSYAGFAEVGTREYAESALTSPVGYLEGWFVLPEWRRRGMGRALVQAGEAWAKSIGCVEFASDVVLGNDVSVAAHERLGFRETERLVCFLKRLS